MPNWTARRNARWAQRFADAECRVHWLPAQPRPDFLRLLTIADSGLRNRRQEQQEKFV